MKLATAYERDGKLYVHGFCKTVARMWIFSGPMLMPGDNHDAVGRAVRACLDASRDGVPHPLQPDLDILDQPLLTLAGAKSFDEFAEGAACVQISMAGDAITLIPLRNGQRDGFAALEEKTQTITPESDEELGSAVLAALAMAE